MEPIGTDQTLGQVIDPKSPPQPLVDMEEGRKINYRQTMEAMQGEIEALRGEIVRLQGELALVEELQAMNGRQRETIEELRGEIARRDDLLTARAEPVDLTGPATPQELL